MIIKVPDEDQGTVPRKRRGQRAVPEREREREREKEKEREKERERERERKRERERERESATSQAKRSARCPCTPAREASPHRYATCAHATRQHTSAYASIRQYITLGMHLRCCTSIELVNRASLVNRRYGRGRCLLAFNRALTEP